MKRATITGICDTRVGELPESSCLSLHAEVSHGALQDAGLPLAEVDGLLCAYSMVEPHPMLSSAVAEYIGIAPGFASSIVAGGASAAIMVMHAALLVESGMCRHVLVVTGDNRRTGMGRDGAVAALAGFGHPQFEQPYGMTIPAAYALVAQRYMHEYGVTPEHLAAVAVSAREHAARREKAHMRAPITIEDVLASRMVASPLHLLDCCLISDGAAAVIVSAPDAASDTATAPVAILGSGQGHTHEHIVQAPSLTDFG